MTKQTEPLTCVQFRELLGRTFTHNTGPVMQDAIRLLSYRYMLCWPDEKRACVMAVADDIIEAERQDESKEPTGHRKFIPVGGTFRDISGRMTMTVVEAYDSHRCHGCYSSKAYHCHTFPLCCAADREDSKNVIFIPGEPEAEEAPAEKEADSIPTEPQQPDIGQRFYAKGGTLVETIRDIHGTCSECHYDTLRVNGRCPNGIVCRMYSRDDETDVCFPPVDTTKEEKSTE